MQNAKKKHNQMQKKTTKRPPNSRDHETEADRMGLIFAAMAGYDPNVAVSFWQRMAASGGSSTAEFLSDHPSDATRINNIKNWLQRRLLQRRPQPQRKPQRRRRRLPRKPLQPRRQQPKRNNSSCRNNCTSKQNGPSLRWSVFCCSLMFH